MRPRVLVVLPAAAVVVLCCLAASAEAQKSTGDSAAELLDDAAVSGKKNQRYNRQEIRPYYLRRRHQVNEGYFYPSIQVGELLLLLSKFNRTLGTS